MCLTLNPDDAYGAEDGTRTRDTDLGKVVLYQLSYFRKYIILILKTTGLEPVTRGVKIAMCCPLLYQLSYIFKTFL